MIVRQRKEFPKVYLYCAGGAVAMLLVSIVYFKSLLVPVVTASCSERYMQGVRFSYMRQNGEALSPADLQGRLAGRDWGIVENVRMVRLKEEGRPVVLEINLKKPAKADDAGTRSGMGFTWNPKVLRNAGAACLGYSVWLPQGFDYGTGGVLPGLIGEFASEEKTPEQEQMAPFSLRLRWRDDGTLEAVAYTQAERRGEHHLIDQGRIKLEQGSWTRIEQEVILNEPGEADGVLRIWVDGVLKLERSDVNYRGDDFQRLVSVNADVHYTKRDFDWAPALTDNKIRLSGFELRIQ